MYSWMCNFLHFNIDTFPCIYAYRFLCAALFSKSYVQRGSNHDNPGFCFKKCLLYPGLHHSICAFFFWTGVIWNLLRFINKSRNYTTLPHWPIRMWLYHMHEWSNNIHMYMCAFTRTTCAWTCEWIEERNIQ